MLLGGGVPKHGVGVGWGPGQGVGLASGASSTVGLNLRSPRNSVGS